MSQSRRIANYNTANRATASIVSAIDFVNIWLIFVFKQLFPELLAKSAQYFLFSFAALATVAQALLGWHQVYLNSGKDSGQIFRSFTATLTAIAITAAVVIALGFSKASILGYPLETVPPMIFAATIGANAIIHLLTSVYHGIQRARIKPIVAANENLLSNEAVYSDENDAARSHHGQSLVNNALSSVAGATATGAIAAVMIFDQLNYAIALGTLTGAEGIALNLYLLDSLRNKYKLDNGDLLPQIRPTTVSPRYDLLTKHSVFNASNDAAPQAALAAAAANIGTALSNDEGSTSVALR